MMGRLAEITAWGDAARADFTRVAVTLGAISRAAQAGVGATQGVISVDRLSARGWAALT